mgnify:CR=1 FL=1
MEPIYAVLEEACRDMDWRSKRLWEAVEASSVSPKEIARFLWKRTPPLPAPDKSFMWTSWGMVCRRERYLNSPRVHAVGQHWAADVRRHNKESCALARRTQRLQPHFFETERGLYHITNFQPHPSFDIDTLNGAHCYIPRDEEEVWCNISDLQCCMAVTPKGVVFHLETAPRIWIEANGPWPEQALLGLQLISCAMDPGSEPLQDAVDEVLCLLGMTHHQIVPRRDILFTFARHRLMRQDDNGHEFSVGVYDSRSEATVHLRRLDQGNHKQHYWLVPESAGFSALLENTGSLKAFSCSRARGAWAFDKIIATKRELRVSAPKRRRRRRQPDTLVYAGL